MWPAPGPCYGRLGTSCSSDPTSASSRARPPCCESKLDSLRETTTSAATLTNAELRLLPLMSTHLTFREMGERLYLSPHTVKSQALSVYRKLGVSSRSQAIQRAQQTGLLGAK